MTTRPGAGLAPLVPLTPSQVRGLSPAVRAALREVEIAADGYRERGALLGYQAAINAAWTVAHRLSVDVYVSGPGDFEVTSV